MEALWGSPVMGKVLLAAGLAGIITSWIALFVGASRLLFAMGRSGMLPRWFGKLHPKHKTPSNAVIFIGALTVFAPFFGKEMLSFLADSGSPNIVLTYCLVCVSFVILRYREPHLERPFVAGRGTKGIVLAVTGALATLGLFLMYLPGMPSKIDIVSYVIFVGWWAIGITLLLRVPRGVVAGEHTEAILLAKLEGRKKRK